MSFLTAYREAVEKWPGAIVLVKIGDFYEAYDDSAITLNKRFGLTLTTRCIFGGERLDMVGFPWHSFHRNITEYVNCGYRVVVVTREGGSRTAAAIEELNGLI